MELTLQGKTLLVTGGTQGLGAEIAHEAARRGAAAVALAGRSQQAGEDVAQGLRELGCEAGFFAADLGQEGAPQDLFARVLEWRGEVHGLVNAAGLTTRAGMLDGTEAQWDSLFNLNARAPFFLMQAFIAHRKAEAAPGSIVNIQSINAHCGSPELAIYSASKGALATLTKNAANAHLADRIRVNGINMGWSPTQGEMEMQAHTLNKGEDWLGKAAASQPLGRLLQPVEVARLAVYLLSDYSGLQTGTCIDLEQRVMGA
ncbi:SDR family oxidoreductase [Oceaniglobus trochenteri]|uniref:SDR family oxidoreductase n=1 Tax=Oceaniglobus trochenteri TaxID=2763260 RepID=UPI001CFF9C78|nr:SDR family oxidoreductase [Oceaniglobus trochenteri]